MVEKLYESSDDSQSFSSLVGDHHFYFSSTQVINGGEFVDSNSTECWQEVDPFLEIVIWW